MTHTAQSKSTNKFEKVTVHLCSPIHMADCYAFPTAGAMDLECSNMLGHYWGHTSVEANAIKPSSETAGCMETDRWYLHLFYVSTINILMIFAWPCHFAGFHPNSTWFFFISWLVLSCFHPMVLCSTIWSRVFFMLGIGWCYLHVSNFWKMLPLEKQSCHVIWMEWFWRNVLFDGIDT